MSAFEDMTAILDTLDSAFEAGQYAAAVESVLEMAAPRQPTSLAYPDASVEPEPVGPPEPIIFPDENVPPPTGVGGPQSAPTNEGDPYDNTPANQHLLSRSAYDSLSPIDKEKYIRTIGSPEEVGSYKQGVSALQTARDRKASAEAEMESLRQQYGGFVPGTIARPVQAKIDAADSEVTAANSIISRAQSIINGLKAAPPPKAPPKPVVNQQPSVNPEGTVQVGDQLFVPVTNNEGETNFVRFGANNATEAREPRLLEEGRHKMRLEDEKWDWQKNTTDPFDMSTKTRSLDQVDAARNQNESQFGRTHGENIRQFDATLGQRKEEFGYGQKKDAVTGLSAQYGKVGISPYSLFQKWNALDPKASPLSESGPGSSPTHGLSYKTKNGIKNTGQMVDELTRAGWDPATGGDPARAYAMTTGGDVVVDGGSSTTTRPSEMMR